MNTAKALLLSILVGIAAFPGSAQLVGNSLRSYDRSAPIDFAADRIEVLETEQQALFTGNVEVSQGTLDLSAASVRVLYDSSRDLSVSRLIAEGSVSVRTPSETARASRAIYDVPRSIVTLLGDVRLARGGDTLTGDRLVIDLNSGSSSIGGGRVTGRFTPASIDTD